MRSIHWRRVILGGLLAGMVINVFEFFLNGVILAKDWQVAMLALGRPPIVGGQIAVFFIWSFILWGLSHRHLFGLAVCGHSSALRCRTEDRTLRGIVRLEPGLSADFSHTVSPKSLSSPHLCHWPHRRTGRGLAGNAGRLAVIPRAKRSLMQY